MIDFLGKIWQIYAFLSALIIGVSTIIGRQDQTGVRVSTNDYKKLRIVSGNAKFVNRLITCSVHMATNL